MVTLFLRVALFAVVIVRESRSETVVCGTGSPCLCGAGSTPCTLDCTTNGVCRDYQLGCRDGQYCTVDCSGTNACNGAIVQCPTGADCLVNCPTPGNVCSGLTMNDTGDSTSVVCDGANCPPQYTRAPTAPSSPPTTNSPTTSAPTTSAPTTNQPTTSAPTAATDSPTSAPTESPTDVPTSSTNAPTSTPSDSPTDTPTSSTDSPTSAPTESPTDVPTASTDAPTSAPTNDPTPTPTSQTNTPTISPTDATDTPTFSPTESPTDTPTAQPTQSTDSPTSAPTDAPTPSPTDATLSPTKGPTGGPTENTNAPTGTPTDAPSRAPSSEPTDVPTPPSMSPTAAPTQSPTTSPSSAPTDAPSFSPSAAPTDAPSFSPTDAPSYSPTDAPSNAPTPAPTFFPTVPPTQAAPRALQLNQFEVPSIDIEKLINLESKAAWRQLLMSACEETWASTAIADKLYVDVFANPMFSVFFMFDVTASTALVCSDATTLHIMHEVGNLFGLPYLSATAVLCEGDSLVDIVIASQDYVQSRNVSDRARTDFYLDAMRQILLATLAVDGVTAVQAPIVSELTRIAPVVVSWQTYAYTANEFETFLTSNLDALKSNIAAQLDHVITLAIAGISIDLENAIAGISPIVREDIAVDICDGITRDSSQLPAFTSRKVGTGNVFELKFEVATNMALQNGNAYYQQLFVNFIANSLPYTTIAWQDEYTLLLLVGHGASTLDDASAFMLHECIRDYCENGDELVSCGSFGNSNAGSSASAELTDVTATRITGPSYVGGACASVRLSGEMSVGPLANFPAIFEWQINGNVAFTSNSANSDDRDLSMTLSEYAPGEIVNITLTTFWANDMQSSASMQLEIATVDTAPAIYVDGGLKHEVQYDADEFLTLSIAYDTCSSSSSGDEEMLILWQYASQSDVMAATHGIRYTDTQLSACQPPIATETVLAYNTAELVISMSDLQPFCVYYVQVSVGESVEFIELNSLPTLALHIGHASSVTVSIRSDTLMSIHDVFAFPTYIDSDVLSDYYEWTWSCVQQSDGRECDEELIPAPNQAELVIASGLFRGNERYVYSTTLHDRTYDFVQTAEFTLITSALLYPQIGKNPITSSALTINPLFDPFGAHIVNVPSSLVSDSWTLPTESEYCSNSEYVAYGTSMSLNAYNASTCELPFGGLQTVTYNAVFEDSDEWRNTANVSFSLYVNIPPFGGLCAVDGTAGVALSTPFRVECKYWMYTHTAEHNYHHRTAQTSYLRYTLKLVSPTYREQCLQLSPSSKDAFASYSDIQSVCLGLVLSYDRYSTVVDDLFLGSGSNVLVSHIEDRITGATASYIVGVVEISDDTDTTETLSVSTVQRWYTQSDSQRTFSFLMALAMSIDSESGTLFDVESLPTWDVSSSLTNAQNLRNLASDFYVQLQAEHRVTPKVVLQYLDCLYLIVVNNVQSATDEMLTLAQLNAWIELVDAVYIDYLQFDATQTENVGFEMTVKSLEMVYVLFEKLPLFESDSDHIATLYQLIRLLNRIGFNALYNAIPTQYIAVVIPKLALAVSQAAANKLTQCRDLEMDIQWPSVWTQSSDVADASYISCVITSIDAPLSRLINVPHVNMVNLFDLDASDRDTLIPALLSDSDTQRRRRRGLLQTADEDDCDNALFTFATHNDSSFTADLTLQQNYVIPHCLSLNLYVSDDDSDALSWDAENCEIASYTSDSAQCACSEFVGGYLFTLQTETYALDYEFKTSSELRVFSSMNLVNRPIALLAVIFFAFVFCMAAYWFHDAGDVSHVPLLARPDVILETSRDTLFLQSSLGRMLGDLYRSDAATGSKVWHAFKLSLKDYHLVLGVQWATEFTNISVLMRLSLVLVYIMTVLCITATFYGTNAQSQWAVAFCGDVQDMTEFDDRRFCSDTAMMFFFSLFACLPAYLFMSCIAAIRPRTIAWEDPSMLSVLERLKEKQPLWESGTVLNVAKAIFDEAQEIRNRVFFSGQERKFSSMPNIGDDVDDEMIEHQHSGGPAQPSMNAPRPMFPNAAASHNSQQPFLAGSLHQSALVNNYTVVASSNVSAETNPDLEEAVAGSDEDDYKDEELPENEEKDEDDEKDVLLNLTPGGPDDAGMTPMGPPPSSQSTVPMVANQDMDMDEWTHWQPTTAAETDLQFEIAAALIDKTNASMNKAMEYARTQMADMKRNGQPLQMPPHLLPEDESAATGPAAQAAARKKFKHERKKQKQQQQQQQSPPLQAQQAQPPPQHHAKFQSTSLQSAASGDDDAFRLQQRIMDQMHEHEPHISEIDDAAVNQCALPEASDEDEAEQEIELEISLDADHVVPLQPLNSDKSALVNGMVADQHAAMINMNQNIAMMNPLQNQPPQNYMNMNMNMQMYGGMNMQQNQNQNQNANPNMAMMMNGNGNGMFMNNMNMNFQPPASKAQSHKHIKVVVLDEDDDAEIEALRAQRKKENAENRQKMEEMEQAAFQIRELELSRRRLLFTEFAFPSGCVHCCSLVLCVYVLIAALVCIYYGLSFGSDSSHVLVNLQSMDSARRLLQENLDSSIAWEDIAWNDTLYSDDGQCEFVPIWERIQSTLDDILNDDDIEKNDALLIPVDAEPVGQTSFSEDVRWLLFAIACLLVGTCLWQPLIALLISLLWLFRHQYNGYVVLNMLCCNLNSLYRRIGCRQCVYLCCQRRSIEAPVIESMILVANDNKTNEERLQRRRNCCVTLDINGDIVDYRRAFQHISLRFAGRQIDRKSSDIDFGGGGGALSEQKPVPHSLQPSADSEFDDGNLSDFGDEYDDVKDERKQQKRRNNKSGSKGFGFQVDYKMDERDDANVMQLTSDRSSKLLAKLGTLASLKDRVGSAPNVLDSDLGSLHLFAIEKGINPVTNLELDARVSSNSLVSPKTGTDSVHVERHKKREFIFLIYESQFFRLTSHCLSSVRIAQFCPMRPIKQSLFGNNNNNNHWLKPEAAAAVAQQERTPVAAAAPADSDSEHDQVQIQMAIRQSMAAASVQVSPAENDGFNVNDVHGSALEMVQQLQPSADEAEMELKVQRYMQVLQQEPDLMTLEAVARRKAVKQRLRQRDEEQFQASIDHLPEVEKQAAIYDRIQEKNGRKKQRQERRQQMLNDPTADIQAQQNAIMAQIAAGKNEGDDIAAPAAFNY